MPLSAHTTLLIAVIAGAVGGVLLILMFAFCLCRRPAKKVPLPPKQELARYREQQSNHDLESRPATWYESTMLSAPSTPFAGSKSSLLFPPDSRGGSPFRPSLNPSISGSPSEDISHLSSTAPMAHGLPLPPHLSFEDSSTSLSTVDTDSPSSSSPPPASLSDPTLSHPRQRILLPLHHDLIVRDPSLTGSPAISRQPSRNSIRGVPHGRHSQVQIVLPAPLAFNNDRMSLHENSARFSVVDQWAPAAMRSEGNPIPKPQRRSFSSSEPRRATLLAQSPTNAPQARRSASASAATPSFPQRAPASSANHNRDYSVPSSPLSLPPVPQIPQQWRPPGNPLTGITEDAGRGRPRDISSSSELPAQPVDPLSPPDAQRRLQKRSRSNGR
ncbi:hypothetical protein B0H14DRAFT_2672216 [Mycena olivaceomarginata]|nr:hypothetical protein B0H14DRAFT_2672216 [Mycena olivaceomarginata]